MLTVTIEEAQANLGQLVGGLAPGEEIKLTQGGRVVARIVGERPQSGRRPGPGLGKRMMTIVSEDDEHLSGFAEYMP
jgi:antitoxin (DNA-binding transcriptional repressor) of toxin-antitoxin stability system